LTDRKIIKDWLCDKYGRRSDLSGTNDYSIRHLALTSALVLVESRGVEIITTFRPVRPTTSADSEWYEFTIFSYNKPNWTKNCVGRIRSGKESDCQKQVITNLPRKMASPYKTHEKVRLNYGPAFQGLKDVSALPGKTTAVATLVTTIESDTYYSFHPTTIDHCLQVIALGMSDGLDRHMSRLCVPTRIEQLYVSANKAQQEMKARAIAATTTPDVATSTWYLWLRMRLCFLSPVAISRQLTLTSLKTQTELALQSWNGLPILSFSAFIISFIQC
jgi:hypothetical protein